MVLLTRSPPDVSYIVDFVFRQELMYHMWYTELLQLLGCVSSDSSHEME